VGTEEPLLTNFCKKEKDGRGASGSSVMELKKDKRKLLFGLLYVRSQLAGKIGKITPLERQKMSAEISL